MNAKYLMLAPAVITVAAAQTETPGAGCDTSPLIVRRTNVWSSTGIVRNRDVVLRDGRVAAIERAGSRRYDGMRSIDGVGATLLPGLIDAHVHLVIPSGPGGLPPRDGSPRDLAGIVGRQLLRSGVTSARLHLATLDEAVELQARSADPCAPMPHLQAGGPSLSGLAGSDVGNFQGAKTADAAAAKIDRFRNAGLVWTAIHDAHRFQPGVLDAIAVAARRTGMRLMAAGGSPQEITAALTLDPVTLDYMDTTDSERYPADTLERMRAKHDLILVPTPGVIHRTVTYIRNPELLERAENFEFLDTADRQFVLASAKKDLIGPGAERAQNVMRSMATKFRQLRQLGLRMAVGTDAGSPLHFPSGAIWWELEAWRSLGASHREALIAATENGAHVLNAVDVGHLRVGSRADFVLYRGNAEDGVFDLQRVLAVGKSGVLYTWRDGGRAEMVGAISDVAIDVAPIIRVVSRRRLLHLPPGGTSH